MESADGNDLRADAGGPEVVAVAPRGRSLEPAFPHQPTIPDVLSIQDKPVVSQPPVPHSSNMELFRQAVVALLADAPDSEAARQHGTEAAAALLAGAVAGDAGLAQILRPDPDDAGTVTWTVACYQIGDLSPSTLKDFAEVNDAVRAVAHCPETAHVAAELLASSASGLRWPAMVRTGDLLHFQLPSTSAGGDPGLADTLEAAPYRWADRLVLSSAAGLDGPNTPGELRGEQPGALPPELGMLLVRILEAVQGLAREVEDLASGRDVKERLRTLEQRVVDVQLKLEASPVPMPPDSRHLRLARTTGDVPVARLWRAGARSWRPGDSAGLLAASSDPRAAPERPRLERLLGSVSRLTTRGMAAARRERAWWSGVAARSVSTRSPDLRAGVEPVSDGTETNGPALSGPPPTMYRIGWCTDDPCGE
jgi:hypothetical protein